MNTPRILAVLTAAALLTGCGAAPEYRADLDNMVTITEPPTTEHATTRQTTTQPATTQPVTTEAPTTEPPTTEPPTTEPATTQPPATDPPREPIPGDRPPVLLSGQTVHVMTGAAFDLNRLIGYGDDYDPHPTLACEGAVDTNTPGSYAVTAVITDFAGNVTRSNITVNVSGDEPGASSRPAETFAQFKETHPGSRYGVDISKWQGAVDFGRLKEEGVEFVLMRMGYGDREMDAYFEQNLNGTFDAGLEKGVYYYSTATTPEAARTQADWIVGTLNGIKPELPIAFDWESFSHFQDYGISFQELNACYDAFAARLAESGYSCMLYSSLNPLRNGVWYTGGRMIWLAHYTSEPVTSYEGSYVLWQASNTGRIAGIDGDVDMNVMP